MRTYSYIALAITALVGPTLVDGQDKRDRDTKTDAIAIEELMKTTVISASLHEQSVREAPAAVTIVTADEIRRYGYRTLAEALSSAPGFFSTYDHTYLNIGARGMAVPGDWESRILVMVDGHNMRDPLYGAGGGVGLDFPVDMNLIKRIEIVRGPNSALYGSNGMFATVNIITFSPEEVSGLAVRARVGSLGEREISVTGAGRMRGATALLSASAYESDGVHNMSIPGLNGPEFNYGHAIDVDGETAYRMVAKVLFGRWSIIAAADQRSKIQPVSWSRTLWNDRGTKAVDGRAFVAAEYTREWSGGSKLAWRTSYDRITGDYIVRYALADTVEDNRERDRGDWLSTQLVYEVSVIRRNSVTAGVDAGLDLRARIENFDVSPARRDLVNVSARDHTAGIFAQDEFSISRRLVLSAGGRLDKSSLHDYAFSPKAALVWTLSPKTTIKALFGRGTSAPSMYEARYADGFAEAANVSLRNERMNSEEAVIEHTPSPSVHFTFDAYRYHLREGIVAVDIGDGIYQYQNIGDVKAHGMEATIQARTASNFELTASASIQRARMPTGRLLPNSPGLLGKLRASAPILRSGLRLAAAFDYMSERRTGEYDRLCPVPTAGLTISNRRTRSGLRFEAGVRNLANIHYRDPVSVLPLVDTMPQLGRTFFISLAWLSSE